MQAHDHDHDATRRAKPARRLSPSAKSPAPPVRNPLVVGDTPPASILALQRTAGNAAVSRMLQQARHAHGPGCGHQPSEQGQHQDQPVKPVAPVQRSTAVHQVLSGGGRPMDGPLRQEMEARMGADFSDVRLHTDAAARASAAELGARAYTSGNHVVIGEGGTDRHTLAHELTHVVQQRQGPVAGTDDGSGLQVSDPGDRFERAAEANAHAVMDQPMPSASSAAGAREGDHPVQRAEADGAVQRAPSESTTLPNSGSSGVPTVSNADFIACMEAGGDQEG